MQSRWFVGALSVGLHEPGVQHSDAHTKRHGGRELRWDPVALTGRDLAAGRSLSQEHTSIDSVCYRYRSMLLVKLRRGKLSGVKPISNDAFFDAWTWPVDAGPMARMRQDVQAKLRRSGQWIRLAGMRATTRPAAAAGQTVFQHIDMMPRLGEVFCG
jgi:hypothetical protein